MMRMIFPDNRLHIVERAIESSIIEQILNLLYTRIVRIFETKFWTKNVTILRCMVQFQLVKQTTEMPQNLDYTRSRVGFTAFLQECG